MDNQKLYYGLYLPILCLVFALINIAWKLLKINVPDWIIIAIIFFTISISILVFNATFLLISKNKDAYWLIVVDIILILLYPLIIFWIVVSIIIQLEEVL